MRRWLLLAREEGKKGGREAGKHSTAPTPLTPPASAGEARLRAQLEAQPADAPMLHHLPHMRMWTKLRPGVREFLEAAKER